MTITMDPSPGAVAARAARPVGTRNFDGSKYWTGTAWVQLPPPGTTKAPMAKSVTRVKTATARPAATPTTRKRLAATTAQQDRDFWSTPSSASSAPAVQAPSPQPPQRPAPAPETITLERAAQMLDLRSWELARQLQYWNLDTVDRGGVTHLSRAQVERASTRDFAASYRRYVRGGGKHMPF